MSDVLRSWTRPEIEAAAERQPEAASFLRVRISMKLLKTIMDWAYDHGEIIEIVTAQHAGPSPVDAELHFFKRG